MICCFDYLLLKAQQIDHVMKPTSFSVIAPQALLGIPYYDSLKINIPVLLIHAEWDSDTPAYMSQALFGKAGERAIKTLCRDWRRDPQCDYGKEPDAAFSGSTTLPR